MFRLFLGAASLAALAGMAHRRGMGCRHERGPGAAPRGRRGFEVDRLAGWVARRLDASEAQARVLRTELHNVVEAGQELRREVRLSRDDLAEVLRGEAFDPTRLQTSFGRQEEVADAVRKALVAGLQRVHETLDPRQRKRLATLLEGGLW